MPESCRIAVLGAGPIGLECALAFRLAGYAVTLYERGRVADHVRDWGHVELFSPFGMNSTERGRAAIGGDRLPSNDEFLTGKDYADRYLHRLAELNPCLETNTEVLGVSRPGHLKGEAIGSPNRLRDPFALLIRKDGAESLVRADVVIDCTGTYGRPQFLGPGGLPCPGEGMLLTDANYRIPEIFGQDKTRFAGRRTAVIGSGYSAGTVISELAKLIETTPGTRVLWLTRTERTPPISVIENDSLSGRSNLTTRANQFALNPPAGSGWLFDRIVTALDRVEDGFSLTHVSRSNPDSQDSRSEDHVDEILVLTGSRPDNRLYAELQIHECYASGGPMKLAAAILGETTNDCLQQAAPGSESLLNPEPGFFILGSKSYGRNSRFLMSIGHRQIESVLSIVSDLFPAPSHV